MPNPQASDSLQTNKQMRIKTILFFAIVLFASLTSNISAPRQDIKNLVCNLLGKGSSYLHVKF